jgi:hypothetical protein
MKSKSLVYKRVLDLADIISVGWNAYWNSFSKILIVSVLIYFPMNLLFNLLVPSRGFFEPANFNLLEFLVVVFDFLIGIVAIIAIIFILKAYLDKKPVSLNFAFDNALNNWIPALGTIILMSVLLFLLFLLLIVPGVIFAVFWAFALFVVLFKGKNGLKALKYSKSVVKGRWWRVFAYQIIFSIIVLAILFPIGILFGSLIFYFGESVILNIILDTLLDIFSSLMIAFNLVFFLNFDKFRKKDLLVKNPVKN